MPPQKDEKNPIDLNKILLPKKEVHTPDSAQRQSAGVLLAQEQSATLPKAPPPAPVHVPATPPKPTEKKEESEIKAIETYQGDVESLVEKKNVSVVSIAAAEADKRATQPLAAQVDTQERSWLVRAALIVGGVCIVAAGAGTVVYVLTRPTTVPVVPLSTAAPFLAVDDTKQVVVVPSAPRTDIMQALDDARQHVSLSLGLIERLYVTDGNSTGAQEVSIQRLLGTLAPEAPSQLIRTLTGTYVLGVHSYDENQAFLIMQVDSYQTAYAGMLAWETTMEQDLLPLFKRTPPVHVKANASASVATTTASSTTAAGYFGKQASTTMTQTVTTVVPTTFVDQVVANRDSRVLLTSDGDILLLWTMLDRNTIVITTNDATLREIISRASQAPVVPLPQ